jgi:two-component system nitrate/nitrite sensor histidine kinase NarX
MLTYKLTLMHHAGEWDAVAEGIASFDAMMLSLRRGDPLRPLFIPDNQASLDRFVEVERAWVPLRRKLLLPSEGLVLRQQADQFVNTVDTFVSAIENAIATRTALLGGLCFGLVVLVAFASVVFVSGTYVWIIQPLQRLRDGLSQMAARNFSLRIDERNTVEEFSSLALGFNAMANAIESSHRRLEHKVAEKTADLARQNERLAALYDVALMAVQSKPSLEDLAQEFALKISRIAAADAAAVRLAAEDGERMLMLGQHRLPASMVEAESCVQRGECACGEHLETVAGARIIPIRALGERKLKHCEAAGYQTVVAIPMRTPQRTVGEVELFFYGERKISEEEQHLFDALAGQVAAQLDNVRLASRDREMAVSEERNLMAQELHDSIAQSLAFLKIQVQLLRHAIKEGESLQVETSLAEIDTGVRESYADVRALLLHFRTRPDQEDIAHALRSTLSKFELQSGLSTRLTITGQGVPLPPDQQVQVLHVLQEALSNVRKHASATLVELRVTQTPVWRFEVLDDGGGFDAIAGRFDETHVGLLIMRERAQRIGATVQISSQLGQGTQVSLTLPSQSRAWQVTPKVQSV